MEKIAIRWSVEKIGLVNLVKITGELENYIFNDNIVRLILGDAVEIIEIAEKSRGSLLPFMKPPAKKNKNSVYFEIIFKNNTDYQTFLQAIQNKFSQ